MTFRGPASAIFLVPVLAVMACLGTSTTPEIPSDTADSEPLVTQQVSPAPTATTPVTPTPAPTEPPTEALFEWAGVWTMYHTTSDSTYLATLVQSGNSISSTYISGEEGYEETVTLTGVMTADGMAVSGTWENLTYGNNGSFQWHFAQDNGHQFVGSTEFVGLDTQDWCGYRSGAPRPDPCMWP